MSDSREPPASRQAADPSSPVRFEVSSRRMIATLAAALVAFELLLVLLDYQVNYARLTDVGSIRRLCNITREDSLASWFGTTQTLMLSLTLWSVWLVVRRSGAPRRRRHGWLALAAFFSLMTVDDGALLHERAGSIFKALQEDRAGLGARALEAFPSYPWHIVALPFFGVVGLFVLVFLWRELDWPRGRIVVACALGCFVLAVGLDFVEGLDPEHRWNAYTRIAERFDIEQFTRHRFRQDAYDTLRHFSKSIEEFLEMLANTLLWTVFLRTLVRRAPELQLRFDGPPRVTGP